MKFVFCLNTAMQIMCAEIIRLCENSQSKHFHHKFTDKYYHGRVHFTSPLKSIPFVESAQYNCRHTGWILNGIFSFRIPLPRLQMGFSSLFLCSQMTLWNCSLTRFWTESCTSPIQCAFDAHFLHLFWMLCARPCGKSIFRSSFWTTLLAKPFWPHSRRYRHTFQ